jgi:hypothetical protein
MDNIDTIKIVIFVGVLVILGISIYIAYNTKKVNTNEGMNYKMQPGDGYLLGPGGNPSDTNNQDCQACLSGASSDPQDGTDPSYYYDGSCHYSEIGSAPSIGTSIASMGFSSQGYNLDYNKYTCANPGKVVSYTQ